MALNAAAYLAQLQALLPSGVAWPSTPDATLTKLLAAWAEEMARADLRCEQLLNEADPRTTSELLLDWERVAGLPDPCVSTEQTVEQRRVALVSRLTAQGGQSRQYWIDLAESMGYPGATIDEYRPMTCSSNCNDALCSEDDRFAWQINLPSSGGIFLMACNSPCDTPLGAWGDQAIICRINQLKPAHTTAVFAFQ